MVRLSGRIPWGFYEPQMWEFFSQFGEVKRLKLLRSRKTGRSKGTAFLDFGDPVVAQIVADTMDKYVTLGETMNCKVVPPAEQRYYMLSHWKHKVKDPRPRELKQRREAIFKHKGVKVEGVRIPVPTKYDIYKNHRTDYKMAQKLKMAGVEYDMSGLVDTQVDDDNTEEDVIEMDRHCPDLQWMSEFLREKTFKGKQKRRLQAVKDPGNSRNNTIEPLIEESGNSVSQLSRDQAGLPSNDVEKKEDKAILLADVADSDPPTTVDQPDLPTKTTKKKRKKLVAAVENKESDAQE